MSPACFHSHSHISRVLRLALAAALDLAPFPHFAAAALLFGIPGLVATVPLLAEDEDADAHAPSMRWRAMPARLAVIGLVCLFCLMAEGGASDWSAKLVHDDLAGSAALGLGLAGVVPTLFRAGADQPGVSTGPALAAVTSLGYLGFLAGPPLIGGLAQLTSLRLALGMLVLAGLLVALLAGAAAPARADAGPGRRGTAGPLAGNAALR